MSGRLCLIHVLTDCSPLLNGCSWLTDPETPVRVAQKHADAIADRRTVARTKRDAVAAYRLHEKRMLAELPTEVGV